MTHDYGEVSFQQYQEIVSNFKKQLGGGKLFCRHHWGKPAPETKIPHRGFRVTVKYPNGVVATRYHYYDRALQCGKCGRVKIEHDEWVY
jgi:hypothetical protein